MEMLQIAYRDVDRTPLLYVLREMARQYEDLDVHIEQVSDQEAFEGGFLNGEIDLICEHMDFLFPARLEGQPVRFLASCQNEASEILLIAPHLNDLSDLEGQRIAIRSTPSTRRAGIYWLKQLGIYEQIEVLIVSDKDVGRWQQWRRVAESDAAATICSPLYIDSALDAGLKILEVPRLAKLGPLFLAALGPFITENEDKLRRLIRALYRALYAFHERPGTCIDIMGREPAELLGIESRDDITIFYERLRKDYVRSPLPTPEALAATFALLREDYEGFTALNYMSMWDLRYVLELEESRFLESLS